MQATRRSHWRFWKDSPTTDAWAFVSLISGALILFSINLIFNISIQSGLLFLTLWFCLSFCVLQTKKDVPREVLGSVALIAVLFFVSLCAQVYSQ
jgi:hypothetical protein